MEPERPFELSEIWNTNSGSRIGKLNEERRSNVRVLVVRAVPDSTVEKERVSLSCVGIDDLCRRGMLACECECCLFGQVGAPQSSLVRLLLNRFSEAVGPAYKSKR